MVYELKEKSTI